MSRVIDQGGVRHIARLASLSLRDDELARLAEDLDGIVRYVEVLRSADLSALTAPFAEQQARGALPLRADVPGPSLDRADVLCAAPAADEEGFSVPTFVEV